MPKVASSTCFTYKSDEDRSIQENLQIIFEHINNTVQTGVPFSIKLELEAEAMSVEDVNKIVQEAIEEVTEMEKNAMIPIAIDSDNTAVYKRKQDIG